MKLPRLHFDGRLNWKSLTGLPTIAGLRRGEKLSLSGLTLFVSIVYLASIAFDSPVRYTLNLMHLAPLIYLRDGALAAVLSLEALQSLRLHHFHKGMLLLFGLFAFHAGIGLLMLHNPVQVIFGIKIFFPFLAGSLAAARLNAQQRNTLFKAMSCLWLFTVIGIFIEATGINFPWKGFSVEIGGMTVEGNRSWVMGGVGISRLAGFTRSSVIAAAIIACYPAFFIYRWKRPMRMLILLLSAVAIALTTSKVVLLAFLAVSGTWAVLEFKIPGRKLFIASVLLLSFAAVAGLPLLFADRSLSFFDRTDPIQIMLLGSFQERLDYTWPLAWAFIREPLQNLLGLGLGGIGAAQVFSNTIYEPGDNNFVYMRVIFGMFSYAYMAWFFWCGLRRPFFGRKYEAPLAILVLCLIGLATTTLEEGTECFLIGFALLPFASSRKAAGAT